MKAGRLKHRVKLQSSTATQDAVGQETLTWTTYATVWAEKLTPAQRERTFGQQIVAESGCIWRIRHRSDVNETHRVVDGSVTWDINSVVDPDDGSEELLLACKAAE